MSFAVDIVVVVVVTVVVGDVSGMMTPGGSYNKGMSSIMVRRIFFPKPFYSIHFSIAHSTLFYSILLFFEIVHNQGQSGPNDLASPEIFS